MSGLHAGRALPLRCNRIVVVVIPSASRQTATYAGASRQCHRPATGVRLHRGRWQTTYGSPAVRRATSPRAEHIEVHVLGPLAVEADGREVHVAGSQRRRLLALLASRPGRMVHVDAIVDALWGEDPPPSAAKTVQSHVVRLRRSLSGIDGELIETVAGGYRLAVDALTVDAVRFEQLAADGRRELGRGAGRAAVITLSEALGLWRGAAYAEFADAEFATPPGSASTSCGCARWRTSPRLISRAGRRRRRSPTWNVSSSRNPVASGHGRC